MAESQRNPRDGRAPAWTVRLAGSQEDLTPGLWARDARTTGIGRFPGMFSRCSGLILAVFGVTLAATACAVWMMQPEYEATLRLVVEPEGAAAPLSAAELDREALEIANGEALRRAARIEGAGTAEDIQSRLRVRPLEDSSVVEISYRDAEPARARAVAEALAALYAQKHAKARQAAEARMAFDEEHERHKNAVEAARQELSGFRLRNRASQLEGQKQAEQSRSTELAALRKTIEAQIAEWESRLAGLAGPARQRERDGVMSELERLRTRERNVREEMRSSEARHSHIERLVAQQARLEQAVREAEEAAAAHLESAPPANASGPWLKVSMAGGGTAATRPAGLEPWVVILLGLLAATIAALAAALIADPVRRPAAYVADITGATQAPLLRMTEETHSHVS